MFKQVSIHARVSTDNPTVENQLREVHEIALLHGWVIAAMSLGQQIDAAPPGF